MNISEYIGFAASILVLTVLTVWAINIEPAADTDLLRLLRLELVELRAERDLAEAENLELRANVVALSRDQDQCAYFMAQYDESIAYFAQETREARRREEIAHSMECPDV